MLWAPRWVHAMLQYTVCLGSPVRMLRPSPERWGCAPPPGTGLVRADGGEVRASLQLGWGWQP